MRKLGPNPLLWIFFAFFSVLFIGAVVYYAGFQTGTFELRGRAASTPSIYKVSESFTNGENLSLTIGTLDDYASPVQVNFCLYSYQILPNVVGAMPTCISTQYKLVDSSGLAWATFSRLPVIEKDSPFNQYAIMACACFQTQVPECICNNIPVSTNFYAVEAPYGKLGVDDSAFCSKGVVSLYPRETNRAWFKIMAFNHATGELVYESYYSSGVNALNAFTPQRGTAYDLYLYLCHDINGACEESPMSRVENYTTSTCGQGFDVGIYDITLPVPVSENTSFVAGIKVQNLSDTTSSDISVSASVASKSGVNEIIETRTGVIMPLAGKASTTLNLTFQGLPANEAGYTISASLESNGDTRRDNNFFSKDFLVSSIHACVTLACPVGQVQDPTTCQCVCADLICPNGQKLSSECSTCVCDNTCPPGTWQDESCACHDNSCTLTCGEKEILTPDCTCQAVECLNDGHCPGMEICDSSNHTCVCSLTCYGGMKSNADCTQCVCANTCGTDQTQLSDCSCVSSSEELVADPDEIKLQIVTPTDNESFNLNEKLVLTYKINGSYQVDATKISWYVDGSKVGTKNGISYTASSVGDKKIVLKYDGREKDDVTIKVLGAQISEETTTTQSAGWWKWTIYVLAGLLLILLFIAWLVSRRRDEEEKQKNAVANS